MHLIDVILLRSFNKTLAALPKYPVAVVHRISTAQFKAAVLLASAITKARRLRYNECATTRRR